MNEVASPCKIYGCNNIHLAKGYCRKHYLRWWKYGDPLYTKYGRDRESHDMTKNSEYRAWDGMKNRCYNKKIKIYLHYGGRGITVCDRWRNSFIEFFKDMGLKPFPKAEIDRIDNNGNYEPGNCRWITHTENIRNSSRTKLTLTEVEEIREEYKTGKILQKELAKLYRVGTDQISRIINYKRWGMIQ